MGYLGAGCTLFAFLRGSHYEHTLWKCWASFRVFINCVQKALAVFFNIFQNGCSFKFFDRAAVTF